MSTCPNGHQANADNWCEICGHRMASPDAAAPAAPYTPPFQAQYEPGYEPQHHEAYEPQHQAAYQPQYEPQHHQAQYEPQYEPQRQAAYQPQYQAQYEPQQQAQHEPGYQPQYGAPQVPGPGAAVQPSAPGGEPCPVCGTPREGLSRFCEECRHNFAAHSGTQSIKPAPPNQAPPYERYDSEGSRPSQVNRPAEPLAPEAITTGSNDFVLSPPRGQGPFHPQEGTGTWTAVAAADREYFTAMMARSGPEGQGLFFPQYSPEQRVVLSGGPITIGRRRHSTGESPDIDLSRSPEDPGVSHKHAMLVPQPDGGWAVIDQDSTNGTTLNGAEDPIDPYVPVPLKEGDRVHVGAWTTIAIVRE
jgi:hypothetical protein